MVSYGSCFLDQRNHAGLDELLLTLILLLDGKLISLEEVWENVPDVYRKRLEYEKWTFLTQQVGNGLCHSK